MNCRSCCGSVESVLNLGNQPLANRLLSTPDEHYDTFPLEVVRCVKCGLVQLSTTVPPRYMFLDYPYYASVNAPVVEAAKELVKHVQCSLAPGSTVVEIGSNDGYLLKFYRECSDTFNILGVDPAVGPAWEAAKLGIETRCEFFTEKLAHDLPNADVVHANNVLAHVPDINDFVSGIEHLLKPDGRLIVEVPLLEELVRSKVFDVVYHEHVFYFTKHSVEQVFANHGLFISNFEAIDKHGGSGRFTATKDRNRAIHFEEYYIDGDWQRAAEAAQKALVETLSKVGRVWGFGAAAKSTVMMNACGITSSLVSAVADETPAKIGKYIPGTGVQICTVDDWQRANPEYTLNFAWNFHKEITKRFPDNKWLTPYEKGVGCGQSE